MTKKLLICIASVLLFTGVAKAQEDIIGTYVGTLGVTLLGGEEDLIPNSNIILGYNASDETYTLSVKDFVFGDGDAAIDVGDLEVDNITRSVEDGIIILSKEGYSDAPEKLQPLGDIKIYFSEDAPTTIFGDELRLELDVRDGETKNFVIVTFTGTKQASTNLINRSAYSLEIYFNNNVINVIGSEVNNYTIFGINGNMIEAGYIQNEQINIANIPNGVYFLQVGNKVAKFVK